MKLLTALTLIILSCTCCISMASAQLEITEIFRRVSTHIWEYPESIGGLHASETLQLPGQFQGEALLAANSMKTSATQNTMAFCGEGQLALVGQMALDNSRTDPGIEYEMGGTCTFWARFTVEDNSEYELSGNITGSGSYGINLRNRDLNQNLIDVWLGNTHFSFSGQLAPGNYYISFGLIHAVNGTGPQETHAGIDFLFYANKNAEVLTQSMTLDGIKALYR